MFRQWQPLVLVLIVAFIVRIVNLEGRSLWYDEAFTVLFAEKGWDAMLDGTLSPAANEGAAEAHPLLFYATLNVWMDRVGQSPFAVRLWSVLLGTATVGIVYLIGRALFDQQVAILAGLIASIAPFHVQYSQETRMYVMLALFLMLATYCFVRGWKTISARSAWGWWVAFGVSAGLAMYSQQLAAFYLVALALVPLFARRRDQLIRVFVGGVIALMIYLPWLVNLPGQLGKMRSLIWLEPANFARPLRTIQAFLVVNLDIPQPIFMVALIGALVVVVFTLLQVVLYLRRKGRKPDQNALLFTLWLAGGPPALLWLASQLQPLYLERGLLPSALMLYLVLAWFFLRSGLPRPVARLIGVIGLVLVGIGLYYQYTWDTFPNSPFQAAGAYIREHWQDGDVIVNQNKLIGIPLVYYERDLNQRYVGDAPGSPQDTLALPTQETLQLMADGCVQSAAADGARVWWVTFDFAEKQYEAAGRPEMREAMDWLAANYTLAETQHFNDLEVSLYIDPRIEEAKCIVS